MTFRPDAITPHRLAGRLASGSAAVLALICWPAQTLSAATSADIEAAALKPLPHAAAPQPAAHAAASAVVAPPAAAAPRPGSRAAASVAAAAPAVSSRCVDEDGGAALPATGTPERAADADAPRLGVQAMVREALQRSNAIGAAKLLTEAAASDVDEASAAWKPQASLGGTAGGVGVMGHNIVTSKGGQVRATVNVTAPIYDGGRVAYLTSWRKNLYEATRQGQLTQQEQIALQTVSLALDRSRYRLQMRVYQQYARKMGCLVDALQTLVNVDKGRASELVQAKKTLQQAELSQSQSLSMLRQVESRLARFVGEPLPEAQGLSTLLLEVPPIETMLAQAERASEIAALQAQTKAAESYASVVASLQKPQLSWIVTGTQTVGNGSSTTALGGLTFSVPLLSPGSDATLLAVNKRVQAARLQLADTLEARRWRMVDVHEQTVSAFDRARQTVGVVRNSELLRNFTLQQWQQIGRRSLFDVMATESEHYNLRIAYVNALHDGEQSNALLRSLGLGIAAWLE